MRVAEADQLALGEGGHRERALEPRDRVRDRLVQRRRIVRDQRSDHLGVGGGRQPDAVLPELLAQLGSVDEIPVVPERDRAGAAVVDERLGVRPVARPGGRVAGVADRDLAVQTAQLFLAEDLRNEADVAEHGQSSAPPPEEPVGSAP